MKNRRLFIRSIFSLPLWFTFNPKIEAKMIKKSILLNKCSIAGFQFYQGKDLINKIKENDQLHLVAEPDNQYDKYAVEVYFQNTKLGYIPRSDNKPISRMLQSDVPLVSQVLAVEPGNRAWDAVNISVYMLA